MAIQSIGYQPNFTGKAQTYKGNEYEKTNNGKLIGTGAGVGLSAIMGTINYKSLNKESNIAKLKDVFENLKDGLPMKSFDEYLQYIKKISKVTTAVMTVLTIGLGLGIGAMIDNSKNNSRAYKADMAAKNAEKENKETQKA